MACMICLSSFSVMELLVPSRVVMIYPKKYGIHLIPIIEEIKILASQSQK